MFGNIDCFALLPQELQTDRLYHDILFPLNIEETLVCQFVTYLLHDTFTFVAVSAIGTLCAVRHSVKVQFELHRCCLKYPLFLLLRSLLNTSLNGLCAELMSLSFRLVMRLVVSVSDNCGRFCGKYWL